MNGANHFDSCETLQNKEPSSAQLAFASRSSASVYKSRQAQDNDLAQLAGVLSSSFC